MKVNTIIGRRHNRTATVTSRGDSSRFIDVFHQQPAKKRVVSICIARQNNVFLNSQRLAHRNSFSFIHGRHSIDVSNLNQTNLAGQLVSPSRFRVFHCLTADQRLCQFPNCQSLNDDGENHNAVRDCYQQITSCHVVRNAQRQRD